jgi:hypothetical protein
MLFCCAFSYHRSVCALPQYIYHYRTLSIMTVFWDVYKGVVLCLPGKNGRLGSNSEPQWK